MLGLTLREEFRDKRLKGTAIELSERNKYWGDAGWSKRISRNLLYPTYDLLKGIEAVGPNKGRPVVVIGEHRLGKSHLMAVLYHAVNDSASTSLWLNSWSTTLNIPQIGKIALRNNMLVIGEVFIGNDINSFGICCLTVIHMAFISKVNGKEWVQPKLIFRLISLF